MSCAAHGVIGVSVFCSWFERVMPCRRLTVFGCGVTQEGGFTPFAGALRGQQRGRGGGSSAAAAVRAGLRRQQSLGPNPQRAGGLLDALGGSTVRRNDAAHESALA